MDKLIERFASGRIRVRHLDKIDLFDVNNPTYVDDVIEIDPIKFWKLKFETLFHEMTEYDKDEESFLTYHKIIDGVWIRPIDKFTIANGLLVSVATYNNISRPDFRDVILNYSKNMRIQLDEYRIEDIINHIKHLTQSLIWKLSKELDKVEEDELNYLVFSKGRVRDLTRQLLNNNLSDIGREILTYAINYRK